MPHLRSDTPVQLSLWGNNGIDLSTHPPLTEGARVTQQSLERLGGADNTETDKTPAGRTKLDSPPKKVVVEYPVEKKSVILQGQQVEYLIQRTDRRKHIGMRIDPHGLKVFAPTQASIDQIEKVLRQSAIKILKALIDWEVPVPATEPPKALDTTAGLGEDPEGDESASASQYQIIPENRITFK